jgi:SAM-dependent methyltransferase
MSTTSIDMTPAVTSADELVRAHLLTAWLPALDGVEARLRSGAMVADAGCGDGLATVLMAETFARSAFTGFDADPGAVAAARVRARAAGAQGNVRFELAEIAELPAFAFDLVTTFGPLAGLRDPWADARRVRHALADDGTWLIAGPPGQVDPARLAPVLARAGFGGVRVAYESIEAVALEARP